MSSDSQNASFGPAEVAELKRLVAAKSENALSLDERDRLEQLLSPSREARSLYISYMQPDAGLDWRTRGRESLRKLASAPRLSGFEYQQNGSQAAALADASGLCLPTNPKRQR